MHTFDLLNGGSEKMNLLRITKIFGIVMMSATLYSGGAFASDAAVSARGPGPSDGGEVETPAMGNACSYFYSIQKIGPTIADESEAVTYHLFVSNIGNCSLKHIDVSDDLPRGVSYVSALPAPSSVTGRRLRWNDVELKAGRYQDFEINVKVDSHLDDSRNLVNTGCAFTPWIGTRICDSVTTFVPSH